MGTACLRIGPKLARNEGGIVVFPHGDFHGGVWLIAPSVEVVIDMNKTKVDKIGRKYMFDRSVGMAGSNTGTTVSCSVTTKSTGPRPRKYVAPSTHGWLNRQRTTSIISSSVKQELQVLREYTGWVDPTCRKRGPSSGCPRGTRSLTLTGFPVTQTTQTRGRTV